MKIKTLHVDVYRSPLLGDCTNHGISGKYDYLEIACEHGPFEVDSDNLPENFAMVEIRKLFGGRETIPTIYPAEVNENGEIVKRGGKWYMMGGNFAHSFDSRFSELIGGYYGAVAIHDRYETPEEYELYSR